MQQKSPERRFHLRDWLNEKEGVAPVEITLDDDRIKSGEIPRIESYVTIGDCNRIVHLDFCCRGMDEFLLRLKKVRRLISALQEFDVALVSEYGRQKREFSDADL